MHILERVNTSLQFMVEVCLFHWFFFFCSEKMYPLIHLLCCFSLLCYNSVPFCVCCQYRLGVKTTMLLVKVVSVLLLVKAAMSLVSLDLDLTLKVELWLLLGWWHRLGKLVPLSLPSWSSAGWMQPLACRTAGGVQHAQTLQCSICPLCSFPNTLQRRKQALWGIWVQVNFSSRNHCLNHVG